MKFPGLKIPFGFFKKGAAQYYDEGGQDAGLGPESSQRLVNYPILSRHFPEPKQTTYTRPWRSGVTYGDASRVADHLTDLNSRKKQHGVVDAGGAPAAMQAPEAYAAPPVEGEFPVEQPPASARRYRR
jgi:hypothetical protein